MAILYVFTINNSDIEVAGFPPSVLSSTWYTNLTDFFKYNAIGGISNNTAVVFANQTALEAFITEYQLTDATLIDDINAWKTAHGISYASSYYTLADASITPAPTPIVS